MLAADETGRFRLRTPKLPLMVNGAGDADRRAVFRPLSAQGKIDEALARAGSAIFGVLAKTAELGAPEIQLIAAQQEIVEPSKLFAAEEI